ncbi:MAG: phosphoenolpyruvate--protein phosphotransferase [Polyangiaceae bacterium]|nr:phosphoenolpyruvate--protein phosphotransferase [Polyangiaceae bacterium]
MAEERSQTGSSSSHAPPSSVVLDGIPGSPGLAIGPAVVVDTRRPGVPHRHIVRSAADEEMGRYDEAVRVAIQGIREVADKARERATRAETSIIEAYALMIEDETLRSMVERHVRIDRQGAEWALDNAITTMVEQLRSARDPYLAERSHDIEFVGDRLLRALMVRQLPLSVVPLMVDAAILVAHDLSPAETAGLSRDRVQAIVTEVGTRTSHTAILARALEIPAVVGVRRITTLVGSGEVLVVDGSRGQVIISPSPGMVEVARSRAQRRERVSLGLRGTRDIPAATRCGTRVDLLANIELPQEAGVAIEQGAQGIGLYRTEFLYIARNEPPSEEEQYEIYRAVLERVAPLPVTLRTFDIGGDKFMSAFQAPAEMNPALGLRAVRLGLAQPELFLTQLRAMVRASVHGNLSIMVPMISSVREFRAVRELLELAKKEVDAAGYPRAAEIPLGMMVEVPAAAILARQFALDAAFFSIGTNDLVQYSLAVDRTNQELAHLASPYHPAILRLIELVIEAGRELHRPVSVCGAMASDPFAAALLIGMGIRSLSMESSSVPTLKAAIGRIGCHEAHTAAERAKDCVTAREVEAMVRTTFQAELREIVASDEE